VERAEGDIGGIDCAGENGVEIILVGAGDLVRERPRPKPRPWVPVGDPERAPWTSPSPPGAGDAPRSKKAMRSRTPRDDEEVEIDFTGDDDRACCCGPGSVPAREWKDRMLPGGDGPSPIAMLDCRGSSLVSWRYMAGIGGTGGMLPIEPEPGENCEA
jgi:hypothetical protein